MSDWIAHDGTCCPVPVGTWVEVRRADDVCLKYVVEERHHQLRYRKDGRMNLVSHWLWALRPKAQKRGNAVIAYRLPRSRAADEMIERIRNLEPERELA